MSRSYFTEDQKLFVSHHPKWSWEDKDLIKDILDKKGYIINIVSRVGCDRKNHDAWLVEREDVPQLIEQLFRQRITVEVQAEGHDKAAIIFVYDYRAEDIFSAVKRFQKRRILP